MMLSDADVSLESVRRSRLNPCFNGYRYSYPLVQYKVVDGKAAVVLAAEGNSYAELLKGIDGAGLAIGSRRVRCEIESIESSSVELRADALKTGDYVLRQWLPLNQDNYSRYVRLDGLMDRCAFLEKVLVGNILSLGKGLGVYFEDEVKVRILDIMDERPCTYKGVNMLCFDIKFRTNVSLPLHLGLGKGVSIGLGTITEK